LLKRGGRQFQRSLAIESVDLAAIKLVQQVGQIISHQIDHLALHGLPGGEGGALPNRCFSPLDVAVPLLGDGLKIGDGVVGQLVFEGG
jgi:hypothetical protein